MILFFDYSKKTSYQLYSVLSYKSMNIFMSTWYETILNVNPTNLKNLIFYLFIEKKNGGNKAKGAREGYPHLGWEGPKCSWWNEGGDRNTLVTVRSANQLTPNYWLILYSKVYSVKASTLSCARQLTQFILPSSSCNVPTPDGLTTTPSYIACSLNFFSLINQFSWSLRIWL